MGKNVLGEIYFEIHIPIKRRPVKVLLPKKMDFAETVHVKKVFCAYLDGLIDISNEP